MRNGNHSNYDIEHKETQEDVVKNLDRFTMVGKYKETSIDTWKHNDYDYDNFEDNASN